MNRTVVVGCAVLAGMVLGLGSTLASRPHPASAHPLGNFSVNQLESLDLYPDRVDVAAAVDIAELPTLQERSTVDANSDGTASDAERSAYAASTCAALAKDFEVSAGQ